MTALEDAPLTRRAARERSRRRFSLSSTVVAAMLLAGVSTVTYPTAANWFSDRAHATEVSGYVQEVQDLGDSALQKILGAADRYNHDLQSGPLRDPFALDEEGRSKDVEDGWDDYVSQLDFGAEAPLARIRIPEIDVDLPIYHGTDDAVLDKGVGHLYGTSLPVGGTGTHAVLSGHSGIPGSALFTRVSQLANDSSIYIDVAGTTLTYKVEQILTVAPDDATSLRQVVGHDYITLLTCTPIGVNSHRLLVRAERVPDAVASDEAARVAPNATDPGFPWWALWSGATLIGCIALAWPRRTTVSSAAEDFDDA
ncbi:MULTISPECIES: class C sortase [unclassified Microbacterium]|uniref:class C sortase n=1 Tax=unclassified Microbacterium TaxID=2609290 RepID=UPI000691428A|nr:MULTISPECIES: class C sortase [unclassified Microbacterium]